MSRRDLPAPNSAALSLVSAVLGSGSLHLAMVVMAKVVVIVVVSLLQLVVFTLSMAITTNLSAECTACGTEIRSLEKIDYHRQLNVAMCVPCVQIVEKCARVQSLDQYHVQRKDNCYLFRQEEDLNQCSCCELNWCTSCIIQNFGDESIEDVPDDFCWACFVCNPDLLSQFRIDMEYYLRHLDFKMDVI